VLHENPLLSFARDFSGDDAAILKQVEGWIASPPEDWKVIGFHGSAEYNPNTRSFLATVSLLANEDKIYQAEDKYLFSILGRWCDERVIDPATLPRAAKAVFGPYITGEEVDDDYHKTVWSLYAEATEEFEQHIASRGRTLLSVDATDGDTMFFALVKSEIARRWRDKALCEQDGYRSGVRSPMWDRFWDHMACCLGDLWATKDQEGCPSGTRLRSETIPFAE
jgi:hypothetical protein